MKQFCPNCEKETDCAFDAELYSCNECEEDFASYEKPSAAALTAGISRLQTGVSGMAQEIVNRAVDNERLFLRAEALQKALEHILDGDEYPARIARAALSGIEPSIPDVSVTQDVLMTIKKRAVDAIEIVAPIDRTLNWYIDSAGNIFAVHQTEPVSIEERLAVIAHAVADDVINLIYEIEAKTKLADGLSEMVEMYKTMLRSKDIIIGQQERRINELAERLLKGGE